MQIDTLSGKNMAAEDEGQKQDVTKPTLDNISGGWRKNHKKSKAIKTQVDIFPTSLVNGPSCNFGHLSHVGRGEMQVLANSKQAQALMAKMSPNRFRAL